MPNKTDSTHSLSRRAFIEKSGKLSLAAIGGAAFLNSVARAGGNGGGLAYEPKIARGKVFIDANRSGLAQGQKGVPGVLVSNGLDIVQTDATGLYALPVSDETIIHVIKPRGFMTRLDTLNLPRFYYIHQPKGSPDADFIYKGIEPTGPLPESVDFPLYPQEEPDLFEIIVTADPQPYNLQHVLWYAESTSREFTANPPAFALALGDIVGDNLDLFEPYNEVNAQTGFPWYNLIGNHDLNYMAKSDRYARETFKRVFGPTSYAFQYGQVHFIFLDNVYFEGFQGYREDGLPYRNQYYGHLRPEQIEYVRNYVKFVPADERIVICGHIPLAVNPEMEPTIHSTPEFGEILEILSGHRHTLSLSGHIHRMRNRILNADDGYHAPDGATHIHTDVGATCGSWYRGPLDGRGIPISPGRDGSPKGYLRIRFDGAEHYHIRFKGLSLPESDQMEITMPSPLMREDADDAEIIVNVFNGAADTQVRLQIDDGTWTDMVQFKGYAPTYLALRERSLENPGAGAGRLAPERETDHLWRAKLPADIADGWHQATVEVTDRDGSCFTDSRPFLIAESDTSLIPFRRWRTRPEFREES